jgi:hypothetical protein
MKTKNLAKIVVAIVSVFAFTVSVFAADEIVNPNDVGNWTSNAAQYKGQSYVKAEQPLHFTFNRVFLFGSTGFVSGDTYKGRLTNTTTAKSEFDFENKTVVVYDGFDTNAHIKGTYMPGKLGASEIHLKDNNHTNKYITINDSNADYVYSK